MFREFSSNVFGSEEVVDFPVPSGESLLFVASMKLSAPLQLIAHSNAKPVGIHCNNTDKNQCIATTIIGISLLLL